MSATCTVYKHGLVIALTNVNAIWSFATLGNNTKTRALIWAAAISKCWAGTVKIYSVHCLQRLEILCCVLWDVSCGEKKKKKISATKHFSDWWMQAPGFNLFMFQIISPTGHYSPHQPLFPGDGGTQHGNKCRGPILILFYCLAFAWWSLSL